MQSTSHTIRSTTTITETVTQSNQSVYQLSLQHKDPEVVLQEMMESDLFTAEQQQQIHNYIDIYTKEDAPLLLSLFISEILWPAMTRHVGDREQIKLGDIEDYVKEILAFLLPNTNIDSYIKENALLGDEGSDFEKECKKTDIYFQKKKEEIFQFGGQCYQIVLDLTKQLEGRLLDLLNLKEAVSNGSQKQQQSADEKLAEIIMDLENLEKTYQALGQQIQQVTNTYESLLRKCYDLINSIKRL